MPPKKRNERKLQQSGRDLGEAALLNFYWTWIEADDALWEMYDAKKFDRPPIEFDDAIIKGKGPEYVRKMLSSWGMTDAQYAQYMGKTEKNRYPEHIIKAWAAGMVARDCSERKLQLYSRAYSSRKKGSYPGKEYLMFFVHPAEKECRALMLTQIQGRYEFLFDRVDWNMWDGSYSKGCECLIEGIDRTREVCMKCKKTIIYPGGKLPKEMMHEKDGVVEFVEK